MSPLSKSTWQGRPTQMSMVVDALTANPEGMGSGKIAVWLQKHHGVSISSSAIRRLCWYEFNRETWYTPRIRRRRLSKNRHEWIFLPVATTDVTAFESTLLLQSNLNACHGSPCTPLDPSLLP